MADKFTFTATSDGTALTCEETAELLKFSFDRVLRAVTEGKMNGSVYDYNGNKIGEWSFD